MENTREKNKRADGRKKTYFDRENKKKAVHTEKTKSVAPEKGKQKKSSSSSKCPYQKKCGGCTYLNLSYEEQLAKKEQFLKKTLKGIVPVKGMVGMENPYHYRNKVNSAFARKKDGTIISGIYEKGTHKVVPVDECLLEDQRADAIIRDIRSLLKSFKIMIYNEDSGYGLLRHVMVRTGFASGEIMVVLVCVSPVFPSKNNFVKALRKLHPEITTIVQVFRLNRVDLVEGLRGDAEGAAAEFILEVTSSEEDHVAFSEYHAVGAVVDVQYDRGDLRVEFAQGLYEVVF